MSRRRHPLANSYPVGRDPAGRPLCRWCKGPIPPPRRTICSDACCEELLVRTTPAYARERVEARDHGVCCECGLDTSALERWLRRLRAAVEWAASELLWAALEELRHQVAAAGFGQRGRRMKWGQHLWEADHVVAVEDGGALLGLENLVTRCLRCHKRRTAEQAAARAARRRGTGGAVV